MDERRTAAMRVLEALEQAGYEAYLVGGCVRDFVMQRIPQDYDVATSARPEEIQTVFSHTIPTGIQHGTVTVLIRQIPIEVTTFRVESGYEDHRRPSVVHFVSSLKQDLARRDFTMNAMAQDLHGRMYDYFSGMEDIRAKKIRTVGNPAERFAEDPLRMVRAARFAAQFNFTLEEQTAQAMRECREECVHLSVERVAAELEKTWMSDRPSLGINIMFSSGLMEMLPPFRFWGISSAMEPGKFLPFDEVEDRIVRWAYLLAVCGTTVETVQRRVKDLRLSNADGTAIATCFRLGTEWKPLTEREGKELLLKEGLSAVIQASHLAKLLGKASLQEQFTAWWAEMPVKHVKELAVNGRELIEHCKRPPGPWVRDTLWDLLKQTALKQIPNQKEVLLKEGCRLGKLDS
ncbi:CCA tRNA nucleotidyltransferase [Lihuaxuella thermophila]|uniref:tRNA nucleotidyltransferase (CCA-adding enzyme) n=1 Tax=Lihuaxuella thermophila TaxID=1173111 RepID=A0A1H8FAQ3_9BACL|nr:CCA tRNA nucleotidyltransferase [Lihuaxuella thermophila]SEN28893.1 tRNA nucleotidyltransferase (CCA-adding enzyme) [Lihuaxuella thermophila]